ncbi:TetR/AcrR family transcriptional regulator [Pedobacter montanisoli]|uniref:TetR/AcrR family transcriptional regulator n=1 Tax=Pedobacter montanisoli TaxID=2923277 RepID=A0ABS9ZV25_9SPHI|nr:TetR/AcrR family transcriptional regulator [Pedobacter montanisoli]MCJ0742207.1 TetR/AcrR family transcriptional regulator [Pedobacter montanisoli]
MDIKAHIIKEADGLFCQFGFKSVTMDDIAKHLGISKKTIYQHFKDKDELVNTLMTEKIANHKCEIQYQINNSANAVEEVLFTLQNVDSMLSTMNQKLFYDLQKYHTKAWLIFKEFKQHHISEAVYSNLQRGIHEGLYREELNIDIIAQLRLDQIDIIFGPHERYTKNRYNLANVIIEITKHFLHGICNEKGLALIKKYEKTTNKNYTHN